jgi:hypothetical protein
MRSDTAPPLAGNASDNSIIDKDTKAAGLGIGKDMRPLLNHGSPTHSWEPCTPLTRQSPTCDEQIITCGIFSIYTFPLSGLKNPAES